MNIIDKAAERCIEYIGDDEREKMMAVFPLFPYKKEKDVFGVTLKMVCLDKGIEGQSQFHGDRFIYSANSLKARRVILVHNHRSTQNPLRASVQDCIASTYVSALALLNGIEILASLVVNKNAAYIDVFDYFPAINVSPNAHDFFEYRSKSFNDDKEKIKHSEKLARLLTNIWLGGKISDWHKRGRTNAKKWDTIEIGELDKFSCNIKTYTSNKFSDTAKLLHSWARTRVEYSECAPAI